MTAGITPNYYSMIKNIPTFFSIITVILFAGIFFTSNSLAAAPPPTDTDQPSIEESYNQAKFYFNQLLANKQLAAKTTNWEKGAQNFRRIYLASPKSNRAAACLFMLGRLNHNMFKRFSRPQDLDESISYYKDTARLFPDHTLADDAYYAVANILLHDQNQPEQAAKFFIKIIQDYPSGDKHPQAADTLKQLSRDYDIALPDEMVGASQLSKLNYVLPVKYWSSSDYTRVVVMASGPVNYKEKLLERTDNTPRRLYIDFHDSYIEPQYRAPVPIEDGLLKRIRTGQYSKDTVRVVLDIETIGSYKIYSLPDPFRVVIDVRGKTADQISQTRKRLPSKNPIRITESKQKQTIVVLRGQKKFPVQQNGQFIRRSKVKRFVEEDAILSLAQQLGLGVKRIVIDPGHGGKDPGAIANGLKEKDIVLDLAKRLKPVLEEKIGCEVLLTRTDDTFITLEERTAIANTQSADLFISLHINAHPSPQVRGLETYFLNLSTNAEAMRVAARENATSTHQMSDLQDILSDILKNSKINESSRLATQVHSSLITGLSDTTFGTIRNLGVKQAPFYVLIGAEMPAILLEIAFISNETDARNLASDNFLSALADKIGQGIHSYINANSAHLDINTSIQRFN